MFVGIDGCRKGWLAVCNDNGQWSAQVFVLISDLMNHYREADLLLIDIPIGLPSNGPRQCDFEARQMLGQRRSSVFLTPTRQSLYQDNYQTACSVNQELTGKKLSKQLWNIAPKIREVDSLLQQAGPAAPRIREAHPELAFLCMAGGTAMQHSKKSVQGIKDRATLLSKTEPKTAGLPELLRTQYPASHVAHDDILDATALAIMAGGGIGELQSLPAVPEFDDYGLPMEIVCALIS